MLGHQVKRGVTSTLERVFQASGQKISKLNVAWSGKTAGIKFSRTESNAIEAEVVFPAIDETKDVSRDKFNNLVGFAVHELGHAWFTDNEPWDNAREAHGGYLNALINGLEDVRIEQAVIDSGYAENSRVLFEELVNAMLTEHGYVEPDDLQNVPFMLAIEGRRLNNGYNIPTPTVLDRSPYAKDIEWALSKTLQCKNTREVVKVAKELHQRLKQQSQQEQQPQPKQAKGNGKGGKGEQGQAGDGAGDSSGNSQGQGASADGDAGDNKAKPSQGGGYSNAFFDSEDFKGRRVEPDQFIQNSLKDVQLGKKTNIPAVQKPRYAEFNFI